ncbi:acyl carrier protein [Pseudoalteromonas sp. DL2-H2.2]|uniref:Carrier domain-containing protein n=1 Tax=Pseudoalteromonas rubra TaxID=43658 RepID=A0A0F4R0C9_9GAMM|nr:MULTISPECIES: acyl carrier protein [Pseudoalteromonas]KJZ13039.1 hypothetical protein TW77_01515 [Pseudoalteromonas rubra]MCF2909097.1 acyl carrier protein [Pseudoalteromonas sp. DL2-H2.2]
MADFKEVYEEIVELILELKDFEEEDISAGMSFEELSLDSLDFIEMQVSMKKKFQVVIKPEVFESGEISTLSQMCDYVVSLQEEAVA